MLTNTISSPYAKVSPLPWDQVTWTEGFWADAFSACANQTVPHLQHMFEAKEISHVVENFRICAGESEGTFGGTDFGDGDFYKWMESAIYTAAKTSNQKLLKQIDDFIDLIGRAQSADGYLSTKQILGERQQNGVQRFGDINDFEVYNFGHLFTCACLHKRITGQDTLLNIAQKAAGYLEHMYRENAHTGQVQTAVCPSHYMGLIELYRTTGERKYLELGKLAIELRDSVKNGTDDNQDRLPLKQHEKIVGHAVRSNYLYAGTADLYAECGDEEYLTMLHRVWRNLIDQKLYITGGCGALYNGTSPYGNFFYDQKVHQAYGYEYQLPNVTAYNETCAAIGNVLWAYRMFLIEPKAEYFDIIEKTMLNINLAAVSLDGKKYFYENMLRRTKSLPYELIWPLERSAYILSYCCPPNLSRTIAQSSEYAYTVSQDTLWLGMYGASASRISLPCGTGFAITQETAYPYDGKIILKIRDITGSSGSAKESFYVNLRIPGWAEKGEITIRQVNHTTTILLTAANTGTYLSLPISGTDDTDIELWLDMPVRLTVSHPYVEENTNQAAVERGPVVYCIESPDADVTTLDDLLLTPDGEFAPIPITIGGRNMMALQTEACLLERKDYKPDVLYQSLSYQGMTKVPVRFIPYFAWDNRGFGEMKIWLPIAYHHFRRNHL